MLGTIEEISNNIIDVKLTIDIKKTPSLINLYVLIKDNQKSFIGEVIEANLTHCKINILGKLEGSNFLYGFDQKPSFASLVYLLNYDFVQNIVGFKSNYLLMGKSPYYDNVTINADKDNLDGLNFLAGKNVSYVNKKAFEGTLAAHVVDGEVPNIVISIPKLDAYNLGYLFFFFMKAVAMSAYLIDVNPFNQPGVEIYKKRMFTLLGKPGYTK